MRQFLQIPAFLGTLLAGVLICSTAGASGPQRLKSLDQFEQIIKNAGYGSRSALILFEPDDLKSSDEAQQILDAVALARAWNGWFCKDGQVVTDLREKMNFISAARVFRLVDDRKRAELVFDWLWSRVEAAPYMPEDVLQSFEQHVPEALSALKPAISFIFEAKRRGNMRHLYSSPRARLHAFRQKNLGLRVISCEDNVTKSNDDEPGDL